MAIKGGGMLKDKSGYKSPFPGDNKDCYSTEGVGDYSKSFPRFADQDGMRGSASHDGDASYNTGGGEPTGETYPTRVGRGFAGKPALGSKMPGGKGLPPPYGRKR